MSAPADGFAALDLPTEETPTRRHLPVVGERRRATTLSMRRQSKREFDRMRREFPTPDVERPMFRADCLAGGINEARPCPFASCAHHLALDVNDGNGNIKINFPDGNNEPDWDRMPETCALDVADRDGVTLEELGAFSNMTRERIRQIEDACLTKLRDCDELRGHLDEKATEAPPPPALVFDAPRVVDWFADGALDLSAEPGVDAAWAALTSGANDASETETEAVEAPPTVAVLTPAAIVARDHYRDEADAEIARLTADLATMREQRDAAEAEVARGLHRIGDGHAMAARLERVRAQRDEARALVNAVMLAGLAECERLRAITAAPPMVLLDEPMFVRAVAEAARRVLRELGA